MAEPQIPEKTIGLAYRGQAINPDEYPPAPMPKAADVALTSEYEKYVPPTDVDYLDIRQNSLALVAATRRLHGIRNEIRVASRKALSARQKYESQKKRFWIGISGGSDKSREAMAEIMTEALLNEAVVAEQVVKELTQHTRDIRVEIDALTVIANNMRKQIDVQ